MGSQKLNVVYVADIPQTGGASASLFDLVTGMTLDYGVNCTVLFSGNGPLKDRFDSVGIRTVVTGHRGFLVPRPAAAYKIAPKRAIEFVRYLANRNLAIRRAEAAIDFSGIDIIHSNLPRNDIGIELARRHGIPHVCHLRELSFSHFRCWSYRKDPVRYLDDGPDAFVAVSKACGDAWVKRGISGKKVHVAYNGIDVQGLINRCNTEKTVQVRRSTASRSDVSRIVFFGGCIEVKGVWDAVIAVGELVRELGNKVSLDIYGHDGSGSARSALLKYIADNELSGYIEIHGETDDIAAALTGHDIGVVCSTGEAFGRVVVEYWAAGLAVVGANTGSIPELLENGERGLLYRKDGGAEELAKTLHALLLNEDLIRTLKDNGALFAEDYDVKQTVSSIWGGL